MARAWPTTKQRCRIHHLYSRCRLDSNACHRLRVLSRAICDLNSLPSRVYHHKHDAILSNLLLRIVMPILPSTHRLPCGITMRRARLCAFNALSVADSLRSPYLSSQPLHFLNRLIIYSLMAPGMVDGGTDGVAWRDVTT